MIIAAVKPQASVTSDAILYATFPEAATRGVLWKNVFLEISENLQENNCPRVSF